MSTQLSVMDTRYGFTPEQVDVIKATIAPGASNEELALFLMVCQKTGLDPFSRQIYLSERWSNGVSKKTPETTIDGFRVIAERSGKYAGQLGPFWCGPDGLWRDVWIDNEMPSAAKVGILRSDFKEPVWGIALFMEYAQYKKAQGNNPPQLNSMWQKMGANQLAKCAESLGLRKAFPRDLSGMYTREEMAQADKADTEHAKEAQNEVRDRKIKELNDEAAEQRRIKEVNSFVVRKIEPISEARMAELQAEGKAQAQEDFKNLSPSTIIELANSLDQATEPPLMAPDVKKPPKKEKPQTYMSEPAKLKWKQAKMQLNAVRKDNDKFYYDAIAPYKHCTHIPTKEEADMRWKILQSGLAPAEPPKHDLTLEQELRRYERENPKFIDKLGAHGFESVADVIERANGTQTGLLLSELRQK